MSDSTNAPPHRLKTPSSEEGEGVNITRQRTSQQTPQTRKISSSHRIEPEDLKREAMTTALTRELSDSIFEDVGGLVEWAFPDDCLPFSVDVATSRLVESHVLTLRKGKYSWSQLPSAIKKYSNNGSGETALTNFLERVTNAFQTSASEVSPHATNTRVWRVSYKTSLKGGPDARRYPDVCLVAKGEKLTWQTVLGTVQLKYADKPHLAKEAFTQLQHDAFMTFSSQDNRRFYVGVSICGYVVRLYLADRAGILGSKPFDFSRNPKIFIRLLLGLAGSSPRFLGFDETIRTINGVRQITVNGHTYQLLRRLFISGAIRGRGTVCWSAVRIDDVTGAKYVIKDTWVDTSRRYSEDGLLKKLQSIDGLPKVVGCTTVSNGFDERHCTSSIRKLLSNRNHSGVEDRVHTRLVTTPLARDLADFSTKKELLRVLMDAVDVHSDLWGKQVLHRDVSVGNIMINTAANSRRKAVLIDLDYAIICEAPDNTKDKVEVEDEDLTGSKGHRTGTLPFMAIGILWGKPHEPYHDIESFIYVLVWLCLCYAGPKNTPRSNFTFKGTALDKWAGNPPDPITFGDIGNDKYATFTQQELFEQRVLAFIHPYFDDLKPCLRDLRSLINDMYQGSTLLTHAMIKTVIQKHMDQLPQEDPEPAIMKTGVKRARPHSTDDGLRDQVPLPVSRTPNTNTTSLDVGIDDAPSINPLRMELRTRTQRHIKRVRPPTILCTGTPDDQPIAWRKPRRNGRQ